MRTSGATAVLRSSASRFCDPLFAFRPSCAPVPCSLDRHARADRIFVDQGMTPSPNYRQTFPLSLPNKLQRPFNNLC